MPASRVIARLAAGPRRRRTAAIAFVVVATGVAACDTERPVCASGPAPALRVEVVDARNGAPLAAAAVGLVYVGDARVDSLRPESPAADEQTLASGPLAAGVYRVRVAHAGYAEWEVTDVAAGGAGSACTGPRVRLLHAALEPAP